MISQMLEIRHEIRVLKEDMVDLTLSETIIRLDRIIGRIDQHVDRWVETFEDRYIQSQELRKESQAK